MIINSILDFLPLVLKENSDFSFFRGHSNKDYTIKPSIGKNEKKFNDWLLNLMVPRIYLKCITSQLDYSNMNGGLFQNLKLKKPHFIKSN